MAELTPMMQQYMKTKEEYKDCILFYRLGDFYEMFFDDALTASRLVPGVAIRTTSRFTIPFAVAGSSTCSQIATLYPFDDAQTASRELEITLTGKNCGLEERAPMCGVPYHSVDGYLNRLVSKGYKVLFANRWKILQLQKES